MMSSLKKAFWVVCVSVFLLGGLSACSLQPDLGPCGDPNKVRFGY